MWRRLNSRIWHSFFICRVERPAATLIDIVCGNRRALLGHVSGSPSDVIKWENSTFFPTPHILSFLAFSTFSFAVTSFSVRLSADAIDGNDLGVGVGCKAGRVELHSFSRLHKDRLTVIDFFLGTADSVPKWRCAVNGFVRYYWHSANIDNFTWLQLRQSKPHRI